MGPEDITKLLDAAALGDPDAAERLLPMIYDELRMLARGAMAGERATLGPTALVHEAWLRLARDRTPGWNHRAHFFGAAARAMRRILVEHARARLAQKRGGDAVPATAADCAFVPPDPGELLDLDAALTELERERPRQARVVAMRYFAGLQVDEVAAALDVSVGTVERDWRLARAWLQRQLGRGGGA